MKTIEIRSLRKVYREYDGRIAGVEIPFLRLEIGRIYGVVGPNGAGKTTLLRCIAGLAPFEGAVFADGQQLSRARLRGMTIYLEQFPERNVFPSLTVTENLAVAAHRLKGLGLVPVPSAEQVMHAGPISSRNGDLLAVCDQQAGILSGGQTQLLGIIMGFVSARTLLLLDEFLVNLDPVNRRDLTQATREMVRSREAMAVYVSHNISDVVGWCDEVIVIVDGGLGGRFVVGEESGLDEKLLDFFGRRPE